MKFGKKKGNKTKKRPIWQSVLKRTGIAVILLSGAATLFVCVARGIIWFSNRIDTVNGVDEGIYVSLGGQEQYLLIRGKDVSNPVLVWLHGGPSSPDSFVNYTFQKYLVDEYTVVNWDQRGCGRTYYRNKGSDPNNETASFEQAQADLNELVDYLTERFDTDKVIVVGHSYGTILGSKYASEHSDKVAAYVGIGQFVNIESDVYSYEDALATAKSQGDDTTDLEAAYEKYSENATLTNMMNLRGLVGKYHPVQNEANTVWAGVVSPYMGFADLRWFLKQTGNFEKYVTLNRQLFDYIMVADVRDYGSEYRVPVGFISGSQDWTTPVKYSAEYYEAVSAPKKDFVLIEGCGHSPQYDAPEKFCEELKGMLREFLG